jgi:undecaprenyl pyrophosphate synthase
VTEAVKTVEDAEESGGASFLIHDGKEMIRVVAQDNCWALQRLKSNTNQTTKITTEVWSAFKWCADIGSVANRVFNFRLKNSEATTLEEISSLAKQIAADIRKEFSIIVDK